jgi:DNA repair ATPase RecN
MDPRVTTPADGLRQQFEMETKISSALGQDFDALQQVRQTRSQLTNVVPRAGAMADEINALEKKLGELEGVAGTYGSRARTDTLASLNSSLTTVYEMVDSADAAPTSQAVATIAELQQSLSSLLARWNEIKSRDLAALNQKLKVANLPPIHVSTQK